MTNSDKDKEFNATLRRLIKQKPKPHEEMKKGREPKLAPKKSTGRSKQD